MKILKLIALIGLPLTVTLLYVIGYDRRGNGIFTAFMLFVIFERVWEGLYTSRDKDRDTLEGDWTLPVSVCSYILLVELCLIEFYTVKTALNVGVLAVAAIMYFFALFLRLWAVRSLGKQWSVHITGRDKLSGERRLIQAGPYRYIAHPVYLGIILEQLSIPLIAGLYYTFAIVACFAIPFQFLKAKIEETEMRRYLGESYGAYIQRTPRFNLFLGIAHSVEK